MDVDRDVPSASRRAEWAQRLGEGDLHRRLLSELRCLHEVRCEATPPAPAPIAPSGWVRVVAWNVQRGHRPRELADRIRRAGAQICLLSELDVGMARTDNEDTPAVIAEALGAAHAYGVEFVELGLGDDLERADAETSGNQNTRALHGNAVISTATLLRPDVVRLPDRDDVWFGTGSAQPRVGGRMAVVAGLDVDGTEVTVASTHLENRTDPRHRAEQMAALLDALDTRCGDGPAIVGGDFNTLSVDLADFLDRRVVAALRAREPARFTWPVDHEPLFEVARAHGFEWTEANAAAPTSAHDALGRPDYVPVRLDWLLVRGLEARRPATVDAGGLSDHHMVSCAVRLP